MMITVGAIICPTTGYTTKVNTSGKGHEKMFTTPSGKIFM